MTSTSFSCTATGEGGPVYLQIDGDQGVPVQSQLVQVVHIGPSVNGQPCGERALPALVTNGTGWVKIPGGDGLPYAGSFSVAFTYSSASYNTSISVFPATSTYVIISVPSGRVSTVDCPYGSCPTYTDSMMDG